MHLATRFSTQNFDTISSNFQANWLFWWWGKIYLVGIFPTTFFEIPTTRPHYSTKKQKQWVSTTRMPLASLAGEFLIKNGSTTRIPLASPAVEFYSIFLRNYCRRKSLTIPRRLPCKILEKNYERTPFHPSKTRTKNAPKMAASPPRCVRFFWVSEGWNGVLS